MTENNSNLQIDHNSQGRGLNPLSVSNRNLLVCQAIWDHEPKREAYDYFQLTDEVKSSEVDCQIPASRWGTEWSYSRRYQDVLQKIPLRSCFWMVPSLPVTATWTSSQQLLPGAAACADATRRRLTTLICHPVRWSGTQVNSPEAKIKKYQESKNPSHRHHQELAIFIPSLV